MPRMNAPPILVRQLGRVDYLPTFHAMQEFTAARGQEDADQIWVCEHPPVYTQGLAGKAEHILGAGSIPVVATNRGGQVTFHGPGQVVAYPLINLQRAGYFVKEFVYRIEEAVIRTLMVFNVTGLRVPGAPGIYVRVNDPHAHARLPAQVNATALGRQADPEAPDYLGKIAALGIKVSRQCTYHGVSFNVAMDLEPFTRINPCGYAGLRTVDLSTIGITAGWQDAADILSQKLQTCLAP